MPPVHDSVMLRVTLPAKLPTPRKSRAATAGMGIATEGVVTLQVGLRGALIVILEKFTA